MKTAEPIKIHVAICEQGYSCFAAWCFKPAVLEIQRGARPPVQYCAQDLVTHLRHLPEGSEIIYSDLARTLLEASGQEVIT